MNYESKKTLVERLKIAAESRPGLFHTSALARDADRARKPRYFHVCNAPAPRPTKQRRRASENRGAAHVSRDEYLKYRRRIFDKTRTRFSVRSIPRVPCTRVPGALRVARGHARDTVIRRTRLSRVPLFMNVTRTLARPPYIRGWFLLVSRDIPYTERHPPIPRNAARGATPIFADRERSIRQKSGRGWLRDAAGALKRENNDRFKVLGRIIYEAFSRGNRRLS